MVNYNTHAASRRVGCRVLSPRLKLSHICSATDHAGLDPPKVNHVNNNISIDWPKGVCQFDCSLIWTDYIVSVWRYNIKQLSNMSQKLLELRSPHCSVTHMGCQQCIAFVHFLYSVNTYVISWAKWAHIYASYLYWNNNSQVSRFCENSAHVDWLIQRMTWGDLTVLRQTSELRLQSEVHVN